MKVNAVTSCWQPVTSGPILGPVLFNTFINDKDTELESTLNKSTGNVKLERAVDTGEEKTCREILTN